MYHIQKVYSKIGKSTTEKAYLNHLHLYFKSKKDVTFFIWQFMKAIILNSFKGMKIICIYISKHNIMTKNAISFRKKDGKHDKQKVWLPPQKWQYVTRETTNSTNMYEIS